MSSPDSDDTQRISTYVPSAQKSTWQEHAEEMDMTQSEYIRTMVQAGRRNFTTNSEIESESNTSEDVSVEDTLLDILSADEVLAWDELLEKLTESVEEDLENALSDLQDRNVVQYSGRNGGYSLTVNNE